MARHITAKKRLTRERALALIDQRMQDHTTAMQDLDVSGYPYANYDAIMMELRLLREQFEWACEVGVFPPSK